MSESKIKDQTFQEINSSLKSLVSRKETFIRGLIAGVATAIGATIIAGVLIAAIGSFSSNYNIPVLNQILKK